MYNGQKNKKKSRKSAYLNKHQMTILLTWFIKTKTVEPPSPKKAAKTRIFWRIPNKCIFLKYLML